MICSACSDRKLFCKVFKMSTISLIGFERATDFANTANKVVGNFTDVASNAADQFGLEGVGKAIDKAGDAVTDTVLK